jgi:hypothetical protein
MRDQETTREPNLSQDPRQPHLTDEQFSELLLGAKPAPVQAHLGACAECAAEAERVAGAIGSFEQQTRLWAERRAAALPVLVAGQRPSLLWPFRPQAWAAAAAAIALAASVSLTAHTHRSQPAPVQVAEMQPAAAVTPATLKADNELLSAIDGELRADESTPASVYSLNAARRGDRSRGAKRTMSE